MFELAYRTFDGMLTIYMSEGCLEEVSRELGELDMVQFRKENAPENYEDGYFMITPR